MRQLRRALRARPRLLLLVLLAFAIETAGPAIAPLAHRHPGGEHAHVHEAPALLAVAHRHAESSVGGVPAGVPPADRGPGIATAAPRDLHFHVLHALRPLATVAVPALRPRRLALAAASVRPLRAVALPALASAARAPPVLPS